MLDSQPSVAWLTELRKRLKRWFRQNARDLPWRNTTDPYAIWVSEIMLQQTQVATVVDYYHRFLAEFPDIAALAAAEEQKVLTMWSGLGYYRRARQMLDAAKVMVANHNASFPTDFEAVLSLPGIGRYTAGAITSFAFGSRSPILEANTIRLFSRLIALEAAPQSRESQSRLWQFAETVLPHKPKDIAVINQAVMELGSLVCVPKQPKCLLCPLPSQCMAFAQGRQNEIPLAASRAMFTPLKHALVIVETDGQTLMAQHPPGGWWQGLWDFPRVDITAVVLDESPHKLADIVEEELQTQLSLDCEVGEQLLVLQHGVTRYRISLHCFHARLRQPPDSSQRPICWLPVDARPEIPLTSTAAKVRKWIKQAKRF